jgi:hypothetical protein
MAVQTYSVDETHVGSYLPQLAVGASSPLTSARFSEVVEGAAARVNGILRAVGFDPADIAADTSSDGYRNCQRLVVIVAAPDLLLASHHTAAIDEVERLHDLARVELDRLRRDPVAVTGFTSDSSRTPNTTTSTSYRSLDTTTGKARRRFFFDSRRPGKDEGGFYH